MHKREQIKQMLIQKFRTKYLKSSSGESEITNIIRDEIDQLLMKESVNEQALKELDRKIQQKVAMM